jgi:HEAT repeat protein
MIKVFLSSTSKDLSEFRQRAEQAINSLDGYHCIAMENFGARDAAAEEYCPDLVAECDLVVLLLGAIYGSCPPNADKSYTELEYDKAVKLDKPRLVFVASEDFPVSLSLSNKITDADKDKTRLFRQRAGTERIWGTFTTPEQLAALIGQAIPNWEKQQLREQKERAITAYLDHLIERNTDLYPRGVMQTVRQVSLRLDEVYVSLKAECELSGRERMRQVALWDVALWDEDVWQGPGGRRVLEQFADEPRKEEAELYDGVREHPRIVVLGDPGAGKTTLLRFLALQFAQACKTGWPNVTDKEGRAYGETRLPVFFHVADFADAFAKDKNLKLRNFLAVPFGDVHVPSATLQAALLDALQQGKALLLLDGLDEVIDTGDRAQIAREIEDFVAALHPHNRVIVTSRITGYREAALGGDYQHFTLLDLERPQIERFLTRWCQAQERFLSKDASAEEIARRAQLEIDGILQAVDENPGVQRLAVNPLLLTILALIHRNGARLPNRRVELYDLAAKTLLEDWQLARGIPSSKTIKEHEAAQFLWPLAYWLHREKPRGMATEAEIKQQLAKFLSTKRKLAPDDPEIIEAVNDFLHRVRHHTGVLVERAPKQYGFMHLTFEEYFAARELVRRPDHLAQKIYKLRHQPRWQEPILLAIGYVSEAYPDLPGELIRTAILAEGEVAEEHGYESSLYEDVLHRDLLFAVNCIGDCATMEEMLQRDVMQRMVKLYLDSEGAGKYQPLRERITALLSYLHNSEATREAAAAVLEALRDADADVRRSAAEALGGLKADTPAVVSGLLEALRDADADVRRSAAEALGELKAGTPAVVSGLLEALRDTDADVRRSAARALGELKAGTPAVVSGLLEALCDTDADVRRSAARALGELKAGTPAAISGLLEALRDTQREVRWTAAKALGGLKADTPAMVSGLLEALRDNQRFVRWAAAWALGELAKAPKLKWPQDLLNASVTNLRMMLDDSQNQLSKPQYWVESGRNQARFAQVKMEQFQFDRVP